MRCVRTSIQYNKSILFLKFRIIAKKCKSAIVCVRVCLFAVAFSVKMHGLGASDYSERKNGILRKARRIDSYSYRTVLVFYQSMFSEKRRPYIVAVSLFLSVGRSVRSVENVKLINA